jgi:hypothetical protein
MYIPERSRGLENPLPRTKVRGWHGLSSWLTEIRQPCLPPGQFAAAKYRELQTQDQTSWLSSAKPSVPAALFDLPRMNSGLRPGLYFRRPAALSLEMGFSHTLLSPCFGASCTKCLSRIATLSWQKEAQRLKPRSLLACTARLKSGPWSFYIFRARAWCGGP